MPNIQIISLSQNEKIKYRHYLRCSMKLSESICKRDINQNLMKLINEIM